MSGETVLAFEWSICWGGWRLMTPQISSGIDSAEIINFAGIADDQSGLASECFRRINR